MAVTPTQGPPLIIPATRSNVSPHNPHKKNNLEETPESQAQQIERDSRTRIEAAHKQVEAAEEEGAARVDDIKEWYERQYYAEAAKQENSYEAQKNKGYETIRDLKRNQQEELRRVRNDGERELEKLKNYYRDSIYKTENDGNQNLHEIQRKNAADIENERQHTSSDLQLAQQNDQQQYHMFKADQEEKSAKLRESLLKEYEKVRNNSIQAQERAEAQSNEKFRKLLTEQNETLHHMQSSASNKVKEIRQDTSQKLAAYEARQRDPFYRMVNLDAEIHETEEAYILTARIPEHEQKNISVGIKGNNVVISGYRRNEEKLDLGKGRTQGTATYQSFSESFPISWPVESKQMTREFNGEALLVKVPKKKFAGPPSAYQSKKPDRIRAERPDFPENLPKIVKE